MEDKAIKILDAHRTMTIATVRPDGWPQATIVGYANDGLLIYFMISRSSQKFANIASESRVALAVGQEVDLLPETKAVYAGANASEVIVPAQREHAWQLLMQRHPNLAEYDPPDRTEAAMMCASCKYVSVLDFSVSIGHTDAFNVENGGTAKTEPARIDDWGYLAAKQT